MVLGLGGCGDDDGGPSDGSVAADGSIAPDARLSDGAPPDTDSSVADASGIDGSAANQPPVAVQAVADTRAQGTVRVSVAVTDDGIDDGGGLRLVVTREPDSGTATIEGTIVDYTPADGFVGTDTLEVAPTDGLAEGDSVLVIINVQEGTVYYVAPEGEGSDEAIGTRADPLATLDEAVDRAADDDDEVVLLAGTHVLTETVHLPHAVRYRIRGDDLTAREDVVLDFAGSPATLLTGDSTEGLLAGVTLRDSESTCLVLWNDWTVRDVVLSGCGRGGASVSADEVERAVFDGVRFADNQYNSGGALRVARGDTTVVRDCVFEGNAATSEGELGGQGGAIYSERALEVEGTTFSANTAELDGGAIALGSGGSLVAEADNLWERNEATGAGLGDGRGGAIYAATGTRVEISRGRFIDNVAGAEGGALWVRDGAVTEALFRGNRQTRTSGGGGAIFTETGGYVHVDRALFDGNASAASGGAIRIRGDAVVIIGHSTFTNNEGGVTAAVLCGDGPSAVVVGYSTIAGNVARPDSSTYAAISCGARYHLSYVVLDNPGLPDCSSVFGIDSVTQSLSSDSSCTDFPVGSRNVDPELGLLADNGGYTETFLPEPTSPVVDALPLDGTECPNPFEFSPGAEEDQRGVPRPRGSACDLGAVEVEP
jgi:predicted outer membrane repeat protein